VKAKMALVRLGTVLLAAAAGACASAGAGGGGPGGPADTLMQPILEDARQRSGDASAHVVSAEAVTWSDGSLGCPQPDRMYTQALVRGWRIRVAAAGQELDYHASVRGAWVLCQPGRAKPPLPGGAVQ
jgi:hypothetical protein